jgi:hypothetical protein
MVSHDPVFVMEAGQPSPDGYLLNLRTKQLRRLPYEGFVSMPGCFLKDRREVIVSGVDLDGQMGLLKLNLLTRENTEVAYGPFKGGITLMAELSPDGRKVATMQALGGEKMTDLQIRVIDLQSGRSELLGKPGNIGAPFSWLPDGDGLVLKRFERTSDLHAIEPRILCRLGLDGKLTDLRRGDWPVVLRKSRRMLYQDDATRLWHTCDLDGTKSELFAEGLKGYGFPAVSPDETKIIFTRFEKGKAPRLMVFEFGKADGKPAVQAKGFMGTPVWR